MFKNSIIVINRWTVVHQITWSKVWTSSLNSMVMYVSFSSPSTWRSDGRLSHWFQVRISTMYCRAAMKRALARSVKSTGSVSMGFFSSWLTSFGECRLQKGCEVQASWSPQSQYPPPPEVFICTENKNVCFHLTIHNCIKLRVIHLYTEREREIERSRDQTNAES